MTEEERNKLYRQMADSFINVANQHAEQHNRNMVSSSFLYGASRFSAFATAVQAQELERYDNEREAAVEYFVSEFRRMLNENLDSYRQVFQPVTTPAMDQTHSGFAKPKKSPQTTPVAQPQRILSYENLVKKTD